MHQPGRFESRLPDMNIRRESVHHYVRMMQRREFFSFAGYSDAEWRCIFGGEWEGTTTGLGQIISSAHGERLKAVIRRRRGDSSFLFAVPRCLWPHEGETQPNGVPTFMPGLPGFAEGQIDWWLGREDIRMTGWERDDVLDDLARDGGLYPWLKEFGRHDVCLVGPAHLRDLPAAVLQPRAFVEVSTPNQHLDAAGLRRVIAEADAWRPRRGHLALYLVSAGVSAAVIIDALHDRVVRTRQGWCLDMGSVWDAFVRAGGQRQWRAELYADEERYKKWVSDNLTGKDGRGW